MRLGQRGHIQEAQSLFESAVAGRPRYLEAWLNLAVCYDSTGRPNDAEAAIRRALSLDLDGTAALLGPFLDEGKPEVAARLREHLHSIGASNRRSVLAPANGEP